MSKQRFTYIDALRGIAIIGVIITHAASITSVSGPLRSITNIGGMGVQLFFVISAFTIFYSLMRDEMNENKNRDFFIKRLFRIIPVYWLGIIIYTFFYGLESRGWRSGPEIWHYPFHIFFVNSLHPETSSSVVPGGWSISVEVLFYLTAPLLFIYLNTKKRVLIFLAICLTVIPVLNTFIKNVSISSFFSEISNKEVNNFFYRWLPNQLACFGFGILFFKLFQVGNYKKYISAKAINLTLIALTTFLVFGAYLFPLPFFQKHHIVSFLFMMLALLLSVNPAKLLVNNFTVFMGKISYSSYLVHFLVINQITIAIQKFLPSVSNSTIQYFSIVAVLGFALTIPFAYLGYKYVETPSISLGRKLISYLNEKKANRKSVEQFQDEIIKF